MLRAEVGTRVRYANKASAECIMRGRGIGQNSRKDFKKRGICGKRALRRNNKEEGARA